jgi:hypothetical protein
MERLVSGENISGQHRKWDCPDPIWPHGNFSESHYDPSSRVSESSTTHATAADAFQAWILFAFAAIGHSAVCHLDVTQAELGTRGHRPPLKAIAWLQ